MRAHRGEQDQPWREDPVRLTLLTTPLVKGTGLRRRPVRYDLKLWTSPLHVSATYPPA
jgi:hypothetical protein